MRAPLADPARWTVTVLPLPKGYSRASGVGFCGGRVAGEAVVAVREPVPHWWPGGQPARLVHPTQKRLSARAGTGDVIPGFWRSSSGRLDGAVGWRLVGGKLTCVDLHPRRGWLRTVAMGAGGGAFAGFGTPMVKKGMPAVDRALCWNAAGALVELPPAVAGAEATAGATDGRWVVGCAHGGPTIVGRYVPRFAALWPVDGSRIVLLNDRRSVAQAYGVADGEQVGVRLAKRWNRAALWRGSAASFVDLTPRGHQSGQAHGCAGGYQVGHVLVKETIPNGASSMSEKAALWRGSAASFIDLHGFVSGPWNASVARAVEIRDGALRIVGSVIQVTPARELTRHDSQALAAEQPVLWEARLDRSRR